MIDKLTKAEVQDYIFEHEDEDENALILKKSTIFDIPSRLIAEQIAGRKRIKHRLPTYYSTKYILYPASINLEQSSSELTARFKAEIISSLNAKVVADLTSGFGVDTFCLATSIDRVHAVEPNHDLSKIARHNHEKLGLRNITYHQATAEKFLDSSSIDFDCIYVDPSRRDQSKSRVFKFSDCSPDVVKLQARIFDRSQFVLIKASPLIDIQQGIRDLRNVEKVFVVAVDNDCKEVLFLCNRNFQGEPSVQCEDLSRDVKFKFSFSDERSVTPVFGDPQKYLYEPSASILKAGAFKLVSHRFSISKIHPNTHLYTSSNLVSDFPGRIFETRKQLKKNITEAIPSGKANIITRNYPLKPDDLRKKLRLIDGGDDYVLAFTGKSAKHVLLTRRIK